MDKVQKNASKGVLVENSEDYSFEDEVVENGYESNPAYDSDDEVVNNLKKNYDNVKINKETSEDKKELDDENKKKIHKIKIEWSEQTKTAAEELINFLTEYKEDEEDNYIQINLIDDLISDLSENDENKFVITYNKITNNYKNAAALLNYLKLINTKIEVEEILEIQSQIVSENSTLYDNKFTLNIKKKNACKSIKKLEYFKLPYNMKNIDELLYLKKELPSYKKLIHSMYIYWIVSTFYIYASENNSTDDDKNKLSEYNKKNYNKIYNMYNSYVDNKNAILKKKKVSVNFQNKNTKIKSSELN